MLTTCADCPAQLRESIAGVLVILLLLSVALFLFKSRNRVVKLAGRILLVIVGYIYLFATVGLLRYGIAQGSPLQASDTRLTVSVLVGWYILTVAAIWFFEAARRFRRAKV